jgi:uncharacterized protein YoxC
MPIQFSSEKQEKQVKQENIQSTKREYSFYSLLEEGISKSAEYVQKNSRNVVVGSAIALSFSFMLGYIIGMNTTTNRNFSAVNSSLSLINKQNMEILRKLEELNSKYEALNSKVQSIEFESKSRLNTIENKVQFKEAVQKGEEHVQKMEKKRGWKKLLPWNWF